jgi:hypothetical protein
MRPAKAFVHKVQIVHPSPKPTKEKELKAV